MNGSGAAHTKIRLPVKLVFTEEFPEAKHAFLREKQIKGWSRAKKEALIKGNFEQLKHLSKSKSNP